MQTNLFDRYRPTTDKAVRDANRKDREAKAAKAAAKTERKTR